MNLLTQQVMRLAKDDEDFGPWLVKLTSPSSQGRLTSSDHLLSTDAGYQLEYTFIRVGHMTRWLTLKSELSELFHLLATRNEDKTCKGYWLPCVIRLPVHSHKAHSDKQDEEAHEFQVESMDCLFMNSASLLNIVDEMCELNNVSNTHLIGTSGKWTF